MDADDLFNVFDEDPNTQNNKSVPNAPQKHSKRPLSIPAASSNGPSDLKAAPNGKHIKVDRVTSRKALVTDSFETEALRTVTASEGLIDATKTLNSTDQVQGDLSQDPHTQNDSSKVVLSHQVRHQVALPPNYDYVPISQHQSSNPARTYKFTLDPFQAVAIASIERNESVLVSAHTSAGKTVVAEYAIAQSLREKQRVIYTSPIKALSNQKYRELLADFGDVGLMTGDVTINPDASCLVMTTEILRSMLYRGSEVTREVAWVIFDEIHYMRDAERGVVWEETLILLPDNVRFVFLSATIPNAMQFAEWICKIHDQPCHVVYTNFRPTPLQHYLFPAGGKGIHLVVDEKGNFREDNFAKAIAALQSSYGDDPASFDTKGKKGETRKGGKADTPDIYKIVKMIMIKNYNPVIVFSFSKRDCESLALKLSKLDFNTDDEHEMVEKVFNNAISQLSEQDRSLPQIRHILPLLRRGTGIHHSGLLPILKEIIEILFQEGLIKVLFATETFSIGLNMPAKTVVFTGVRKFDGREQRWVSGGEYIQMSGRAGRRGLDDRGIVILMLDEQMEPAIAKGMVKGEADRLDSAFRLTYNMILNLLRVEGISPDYLLERCFFQFQSSDKVPELEDQLNQVVEAMDEIKFENDDDEAKVAQYYQLKHQISEYGDDLRRVISHPTNCLNFLQSGRLVRVRYKDLDFGWGSVVSFQKRKPKPNVVWTDHESYVVDVLVTLAASSPVHLLRKGEPLLVQGIRPPTSDVDENVRVEVIAATLDSIVEISNLRVFLPRDLTSPQRRMTVRKNILEVKKRFPDGIPQCDPIEHMKIKDESFLTLIRKIEILESKLASNPLRKSERLASLYAHYESKVKLKEEAASIRQKIKECLAVTRMDELKCRKRVLRRLGFCSQDEIVELKGRVACEISSGDELLITELIFNGTFSDISAEQCCALLSCFVFDERVPEPPSLPIELKELHEMIKTMAKQIAKVSKECKIDLDPDKYINGFHSELMDVVYRWAQGASFAEICKMTSVYEGSLIRVFRRLEELIIEMTGAAKIIANEALEEKLNASIKLIRRDLVSAASLYL